MIHQGALVLTDSARKITSEKIATGSFTEIIHLHLKKDSVMEEHLSKSNATLIVVEGEVDYISQGKRYKLEMGDYINFAANTLHSLEAFEDTHAILIK